MKKAMIVDARARNISHNMRCSVGVNSLSILKQTLPFCSGRCLSALLLLDMGIFLLIISFLDVGRSFCSWN